MTSNKARVGRALYLLKMDLDTFVPREFLNYHQDDAANALNQILGQTRDPQKPFQNMKAQDLLAVVQSSWWDIFDRALGGVEPSLVREVALAHEVWANRQEFAPDHAFQVLNSIQRLLGAMSSPSTLELDMLKRESLESGIEAGENAVPASQHQVTQPEVAATPNEPDAVVVEDPGEESELEEPVETPRHDGDGEPFLLELVRVLSEAGAVQPEEFVTRATRESVPPDFADDSLLQDLNPDLLQSIRNSGIQRFLAHQGAAISQALSGANVVLDAGWAVDETPTWAVALAEILMRNPGSHALVLCPEPQRAAEVGARLTSLLEATGLRIVSGLDDFSAFEETASAPDSPAVLVTTPDQLNRSLSIQEADWQTFLKEVKLVAIDQAQEYQGQFGAHAAILIRRLAHRLAVLGANPQSIMVAQGCSNAAELAETLTGKAFQPIPGRAAPAPKRHYVVVEPSESGPQDQSNRTDRLAKIALAFAQWGKSVLVCFPAESLARQCFTRAQELLATEETQEVHVSLLLDRGAPPLESRGENPSAGMVFTTAYRATGLTPGDFDGVVLAGYPGSLRDARQIMETAGRGVEDEAFVLFYSDGGAESRFTAHNLDTLLVRAPDQVVADPDMADIIQPHLPALYRESVRRVYSFSRELLGNAVFQALRRETAALTSTEEPSQPQFSMSPEDEVNWDLRCDGELVGTMSPYCKFREVYPNSVIILNGAKFRAAHAGTGDDDGKPEVVLESTDALANVRTIPHFESEVSVQQESLCLSPAAGVSLHLGIVSVEETLVQVSVIDESEWAASMAESAAPADVQNMVTATFTPEQGSMWNQSSQAFWLNVAGLLSEDSVAGEGQESTAALTALQHILRLGARFTFLVDSYDLATYSDDSSVFLTEVSPRAQGIAKRAFDLWREMLEFGANLSRKCPCTGGCIQCLLPQFPYDRELDKARGLELASRLLELTRGS